MSDQPQANEPKPDPKDLVMPLDELLAMADITEDDIIAAQEWWNEHASDKFKGALDDQAGT